MNRDTRVRTILYDLVLLRLLNKQLEGLNPCFPVLGPDEEARPWVCTQSIFLNIKADRHRDTRKLQSHWQKMFWLIGFMYILAPGKLDSLRL